MANLADAFTTDTAIKTGSSERAVRRDAERGEKISEDVMHLIIGTHSIAVRISEKAVTPYEATARDCSL